VLSEHSWYLRSVAVVPHRVVLDLQQIELLPAEQLIEETLHSRFSKLQSAQRVSATEPAKRFSYAAPP
jgi:hypothetical protein